MSLKYFPQTFCILLRDVKIFLLSFYFWLYALRSFSFLLINFSSLSLHILPKSVVGHGRRLFYLCGPHATQGFLVSLFPEPLHSFASDISLLLIYTFWCFLHGSLDSVNSSSKLHSVDYTYSRPLLPSSFQSWGSLGNLSRFSSILFGYSFLHYSF